MSEVGSQAGKTTTKAGRKRRAAKDPAGEPPADSLFPIPADSPAGPAAAENGAAAERAAPVHSAAHAPSEEPPAESRLGPALLKFIRKRKTALFANLFKTCADDGDVVEAIHDVRVASRRLSEPLSLLADDLPVGEADKIRKALRRVRRAFQTVRDLDVMSAAVAEARGKPKGEPVTASARALTLILKQMERERESAFAAALSAAHDRETFKLKARLDRLDPVAGPSPAAGGVVIDGRTVAGRVDALVADRIAGLAKQVEDLPGETGDPHQVRIAAKRLRYALELADALGRPIGEDVMPRLKALQEVLGKWHDEVVLAQELTRHCFVQRQLMREPELSSAVLRIAGRRLQIAAEELERFSALWPALRDALGTKTDANDAQDA